VSLERIIDMASRAGIPRSLVKEAAKRGELAQLLESAYRDAMVFRNAVARVYQRLRTIYTAIAASSTRIPPPPPIAGKRGDAAARHLWAYIQSLAASRDASVVAGVMQAMMSIAAVAGMIAGTKGYNPLEIDVSAIRRCIRYLRDHSRSRSAEALVPN